MKYTFTCPQCQDSKEFEISVKEYNGFNAICENCKVKMGRVYEVPQVKGKVGGSDGDDEAVSSCAGSCASCAGCGA